MRVTDYQQLEDGRLTLIVQALERFEILEVMQHVPSAIANIRLQPDMKACRHDNDNDDIDNSRRATVQENMEWRDWEFRSTSWNDDTNSTAGVSTFVNYDDRYFHSELKTQRRFY
mmetsp:Transcript_8021/g.22288  ORF Transcript_8021/g.22288 Transcript_8021/m.22288 type:complete len:115 (+) Transcript_8021:216-560(+)